MIRVAVFRPGAPVTFEQIANELDDMQQLVGGYIEAVYLPNGLVIVVNEEGKLYGLAVNRFIKASGRSDTLVGTFFVARASGEDFASISPADEQALTDWKPWFALCV